MKNLILIIMLFATVATSAQNKANKSNIMANIQQTIKRTFSKSMQEGKCDELKNMQQELNNVYKANPQNIVKYWQAYLNYYVAIYYLTHNDKKQSEKEIDTAVEWLEEMKNKTSEDDALLSLTQGFAIQFKSLLKKIAMSSDISKNGKQAIEKDANNIRAYYVCASSDFYRPERFGGGKVVEKYLLKAIELPTQKVPNSYLPSWGKTESYGLLIKWYIRKENWEKAKLYYDKAVKIYPNNYSIKALQSKIK